MPRTARVKGKLDHTMNTMNVYRRVLNFRASMQTLKDEDMFKGVRNVVVTQVNAMVGALEKVLPKDLVELAREEDEARATKG